MSIVICNLRNEKPEHPWDFRVDRVSPVGNPYFMAKEEDRERVCHLYKLDFPEIAKKEYIQKMLDAYKEHGRLRLFCWCAPKQCHAEIIRDYLLEKVRNERERISKSSG